MHMYLKSFAFMLLAAAASQALAESPVSVGAAVTGGSPAVSVQYVASPDVGYHFTTSYGGDTARISADYQRLFVPSFGYSRDYRVALYSGLGLVGQSAREEDVAESYAAHLPVGMQCTLSDFHLAAFVEAGGLIGPLPVTRVAGTFAGGVRATF